MRSYKRIMPLFLAAALFGTAAFSINRRVETHNAYQTAMTQAREYAANGIVVDAIEQYQTAISYNPTLEAYLEAGQVYIDNEDYNSARKWYKNKLKTTFPKEPETYLYGIDLYLSRENYKMAFEVYGDYQKRQVYSEKVEALIDEIRYNYDLAGNFEEVHAFSNQTKTAAVKNDGLWGYVGYDLDYELPFIYSEADVFADLAAVKDANGNPYYIDSIGNVKFNETTLLNADPDFKKVEKFQLIQSNLILAYNGSIWNYYRMDTLDKVAGGYIKAVPISNGVGAVSENGKTWALISADGTLLTDFIFDEVLMDGKGIICRGGAIIVKRDGHYMLVDRNGQPISDKTYDKARAFNDGTYAAVCKNGEWMFVDPAGDEVLRSGYEETGSFSNGLAAVKQNGKWGYINTSGKLVIPCEFVEAGPFSADGAAFVKAEENKWSLLRLYQYNLG